MNRQWSFKTKNFRVTMFTEPDDDLDLSWDEDGSTARGLESGEFEAFCVKCVVYCQGHEVGSDTLCGCIYRSFAEFMDHRGCRPKGYGSYFTDMIREAIREARKHLAELQSVRMRKTA